MLIVSRSAAAYLGIAVLLTFALSSPALARRGEAPFTPAGRGTVGEPTLSIKAPDVELLKAEDANRREAGQKTMRYAESNAVSLSPATDGRWQSLPDGRRMWRLEIEGEGATDLNLGFAQFVVPYGAKLWVISAEDDYYEGPYTHLDNEEHGQLWVPLVPGARAIVELQLPAQTKFEPQIELTHVGYGYRDLFGLRQLPKQGTCNNDVICPEGDPWRDEIASVAAYSLGGSIFCTGQMIMDAAGSFRPYFLTAYHCGLNAGNAPSLTVFWNFESPTCGALSGGSLADNQTGAVFRSSRQDVDQCLVELDDTPNPAFGVYYVGWDRSGAAPQGSVAIHHPNGDEKAISFNTDPLTTQSSCIGGGGSNTHWRVNNWEDGTTEPGSSGSGLWDPDTKLLVGFLSGGLASCTNINYDCYGKFSVAWDGPSAATRLRDWLDPGATGLQQVQGSYPSGIGVLLFSSASGVDDCSGSSDGVWEPGETVQITVQVQAVGGSLTGISGLLSSSTPGVTVVQPNGSWPDMAVGTPASNLVPFEIVIDPAVACFSTLDFDLSLNAAEAGPFPMAFSETVGQLQEPAGLPASIPDANAGGVSSDFVVAAGSSLTDLNVRVQIQHTWVGDVRIQLRSPAGTTVTLLDQPGVPASTYGCSDNDMDVLFDDGATQALESYCAGNTPWYSGSALPTQALSAFNGESVVGTWTLTVYDNAAGDSGTLTDWTLLPTPGIAAGVCEPCDNDPAQLVVSTQVAGPVSVFTTPAGMGRPLSRALQWDGVVGSAPVEVDATIAMRLETAGGAPVEGYPADAFTLGTSLGSLVLCPDATGADNPTDVNGETRFSGAILGGGASSVGAGELFVVSTDAPGVGVSYTPPPGASGLEILVNSADINGDLLVDLADLGFFAEDLNQGYDYRSDFYWDGILNLVDVGDFAEVYGDACSAPTKAVLDVASAETGMGIYFDPNGREVSVRAEVGAVVTAYLLLTGDLARDDITAWEVRLRTSANVEVVERVLPAGSIDIGHGLDFTVGTGHVERGSDATMRLLATLRVRVTGDGPARLDLEGGSLGPRLVRGLEGSELLELEASGVSGATINRAADETPGADVVTRFALSNVPNPFNPATEIHFALPRGGDVEVRVYDVSGRQIRRFPLGQLESGRHSVRWDGRDQGASGVVSGVYFSRLFLDGKPVGNSAKMSLVK